MAFSPRGLLIASASWNTTIWLWDGQSGKQVRALEGHADWVRGIAFSPESRLLASGSRDGTVRLWGVLR
jgi:WD40 repeat protein